MVTEITWRRMCDPPLLGCTPVVIDCIDVGGEDEAIRSHFLGQERAGPVLVDHRFHSMQFSMIVIGRGNSSSSGADHDDVVLQKPAHRSDFEDTFGKRVTAPLVGGWVNRCVNVLGGILPLLG